MSLQHSRTGELFRSDVTPETATKFRLDGIDQGLIIASAFRVEDRFQLDLPSGGISIGNEAKKLFELVKLAASSAEGQSNESGYILRMVATRQDLDSESHIIFFRPNTQFPDQEMVTVEAYLKENGCDLRDLR